MGGGHPLKICRSEAHLLRPLPLFSNQGSLFLLRLLLTLLVRGGVAIWYS